MKLTQKMPAHTGEYDRDYCGGGCYATLGSGSRRQLEGENRQILQRWAVLQTRCQNLPAADSKERMVERIAIGREMSALAEDAIRMANSYCRVAEASMIVGAMRGMVAAIEANEAYAAYSNAVAV